MDFSEAFKQMMENGECISRTAWIETGEFVMFIPAKQWLIDFPETHPLFHYPRHGFFAIVTKEKKVGHWVPLTVDLLAKDYCIYNPKPQV